MDKKEQAKTLTDEMVEQDKILTDEMTEREKTLADEMAEQDAQLAEAIRVQVQESKESLPRSVDEMEDALIDEGNWLEEQEKAEVAGHDRCPVCSLMPQIFSTMRGAIEDTVKHLDEMREMGLSDEDIMKSVTRDAAWYETLKGIVLRMHEAGHMARQVISAHPELRSLIAQKKHQAALRDDDKQKRRQKRKNARDARKKNR